MTNDPDTGHVPDKDELQRAVEKRVEAAQAAAGSEPVINAEAPATRARTA